jgi:tetratricopeptide (TPR) repeat protein
MKTLGIQTKFALLAGAALTMSGCAVEEMQKAKVQADLGEASRQVSIGQLATARQWADRAINADPDNVGTYVYTGAQGYTVDGIFQAAGDYKDEAYYDQKAVKKFPNEFRTLQSLMDAQEVLGDTAGEVQTTQKLIPMLENKIKTGNVDAKVYTALGQAYWVVGNRAKALATYQRGMSIYITDWGIYNSMAYEIAVVNSKPDLQQALNAGKTALAKAQQQNEGAWQIAQIRDTIGWVEYRQGKYKQAEIDMDKALKSIPREPESIYHLGMIYQAEGDRAAAAAQFKRAVDIAPDYADAKNALAQLARTASTQGGAR